MKAEWRVYYVIKLAREVGYELFNENQNRNHIFKCFWDYTVDQDCTVFVSQYSRVESRNYGSTDREVK